MTASLSPLKSQVIGNSLIIHLFPAIFFTRPNCAAELPLGSSFTNKAICMASTFDRNQAL